MTGTGGFPAGTGLQPRQVIRLGGLLWLLAMSGVLVLTFSVVPQLPALARSGLPLWFIVLASLTQSALLVAVAVCLGVLLAPPLGLRAPALASGVTGGAFWIVLRPQLGAAAAVGLVVAALLLTLPRLAPPALAMAAQGLEIPLLPRLLYGGITEEILMRWGAMTLLGWLAWRIAGRRRTALDASLWLAVVLSSLLFGLGHLPAVKAMGVALTPPVLAYIVLGNAIPGLLFGLLYWRRGLEAAILAHALAHLLSTLASR